jgi:hypothetical protein
MEVSGGFHAPADLPPEKNPGTNLIRGWVGPRIGLEVSEERNVSCPFLDSKPESSIP